MITSETNTVVENSISKKISYLHSTQYEVDFHKEFRGNKVLQKELQEIHCGLEDLISKADLKTEEQKTTLSLSLYFQFNQIGCDKYFLSIWNGIGRFSVLN